jgi:prepilin-type N-terminal cleavage/methylation domain-containing protein
MKLAAIHKSQTSRPIQRRGFTLIEMMISVTLVLLMMLMFAEIFELASDSMTLQRALADNDQKVRAFTTVLRGDLQKRSFERVFPYHPKENIDVQSESFGPRRGYLYISLNDPDNAIDNLLQFTTLTTIRNENPDETPYYGNAVGLVSTDPTLANVGQVQSHIRRNSQQPEHDDGELQLNFAGASKAAEIAYYVRGGRLYRRTILIRDPISVAGTSTAQPRLTWETVSGQPEATPIEYLRHVSVGATPFRVQTINGQYAKYDPSIAVGASLSDDYWEDFSFSAYAAFAAGGPDGAMLLDERALANDQINLGAASLGLTNIVGAPASCYRFGFDQATGISREFSTSTPGTPGFFFVGRLTAEEMSHGDFNFPQNGSTAFGNPTTNGDNPMSYLWPLTDANSDDVVDEFDSVGGIRGSRRGEDLLLSNVHAFEIDIWDDRIGGFVQPGHSLTDAAGEFGDYHRGRNLQLNRSTPLVVVPSGSPAAWDTAPYDQWTGRIFDTWHYLNDTDGILTTNSDRELPPYRALRYYPPVGHDYYGTGNTAPAPTRLTWAINQTYAVGDVVFPRSITPLPPVPPAPPVLDSNHPRDFSRYYVCITPGTSGPNAVLDEPVWSTAPGTVVDAPSGEPRWVVRSNVRPLRAIQIRVRFLHEASGKMRQLSLVHSL